MTQIYHLDLSPKSDRDGMYGGNSGSKEGIWYHDSRWIVKYPKNTKDLSVTMERSYNTSPASEYLGSHIYRILGFPVHQTILGLRNDTIVVACKDFVDDKSHLIEFRQLKNVYNQKLNLMLDKSMSSTNSSQHCTSLEAIMLHLDYNPAITKVPGIKERFWDCVVVDGLINNNDRNNGNWGILRTGSKDVLAPVFDNGASFSPNVPEQKLVDRLRDEPLLAQSATSVRTAYTLDGEHQAFFSQLIKANYPELRQALLRVIPKIQEHFSEIQTLIQEVPETFEGYHVLSNIRKQEYQKELETRYQKLLLPAYERAVVEEQKEQTSLDEDRIEQR